MTNQTRFNVGYAIAAIFLVFMIQYAVSVANQIRADPLQRLSTFVARRQDSHGRRVGPLDSGIPERAGYPGGQKHFVTTRVDPQFAGELDKYGVSATPAKSRVRSCATCCRG